MRYLISAIFILIFLAACNNTANDQANLAPAHDHGSFGILVFEGDMELFAESDKLFEGDGADLRAHLTFLNDYSPAEEGILYARIVQDQKVPDWKALELVQAGIFTGSVIPEKAGLCRVEFLYKEAELEITFTSEELNIYRHDEAITEEEEHHDEIIFTKEQAWKTEFGLLSLKLVEFKTAIHCSGEIVMNPGDLIDVIAPASGKVAYSKDNMLAGRYVEKGSALISLLSTGLSSDNILVEFNTVKAEFLKSKANYERKAELLKIEAVSKREYEEAKAVFDGLKAKYDNLQSQVSDSGIKVLSPVSGYISEVKSSENSFAESGAVLLRIIRDGSMLIKANVPAIQMDRIRSISSANVKLPNNPDVFSTLDWGGELVSYGRSVDPNTGMTPVFFSVKKPDLVSGTYLELWLMTDPLPDQIVVPKSSLLEEYGLFYVYVQEEGEAYEKRRVEIGGFDGINYQIISGLEPGEVIVSKGGIAIKVANAMGAAPIHSH